MLSLWQLYLIALTKIFDITGNVIDLQTQYCIYSDSQMHYLAWVSSCTGVVPLLICTGLFLYFTFDGHRRTYFLHYLIYSFALSVFNITLFCFTCTWKFIHLCWHVQLFAKVNLLIYGSNSLSSTCKHNPIAETK